jgi:hypothetical protein
MAKALRDSQRAASDGLLAAVCIMGSYGVIVAISVGRVMCRAYGENH